MSEPNENEPGYLDPHLSTFMPLSPVYSPALIDMACLPSIISAQYSW